jgi:hypothetical protein
MPTNLDKVVKPAWAAKILGIDHAALPALGRPWTKRDVRALPEEQPPWLTEARCRYATRVQQQREQRAAQLNAAMTRLGYNDPDLGTVEQAVSYIDGALIHLKFETRCSEDDADAVAWRRWPKSTAAEEEDAAAGAHW